MGRNTPRISRSFNNKSGGHNNANNQRRKAPPPSLTVSSLPAVTPDTETTNTNCDGASAETSPTENASAVVQPQDGDACPHIKFAIANNVKQYFLFNSPYKCLDCQKAHRKLPKDEQPLWICLCCGHVGCGRNADAHAEDHYNDQKKHSIVVNNTTFECWCYACDAYIPADSAVQLNDCLAVLASFTKGKPSGGTSAASPKPKRDPSTSSPASSSSSKSKITSKHGSDAPTRKTLIGVKGLSNMGNTCFFNAVMQNLAHTLPLVKLFVGSVAGTDIHTPPMQGPLTMSLADFLATMWNGSGSTFSPGALFSNICKRAPRFRGFQQQDSHELLHYLLDGIAREEICRIRGIPQSDPQPVNTKRGGASAKSSTPKEPPQPPPRTFVDEVFGGFLASAVTCHICNTVSLTKDAFLDLSLPIPIPHREEEQTYNLSKKEKKKQFERTQQQAISEDPPYPNNRAARRQSKHKLKKMMKQRGRKQTHKQTTSSDSDAESNSKKEEEVSETTSTTTETTEATQDTAEQSNTNGKQPDTASDLEKGVAPEDSSPTVASLNIKAQEGQDIQSSNPDNPTNQILQNTSPNTAQQDTPPTETARDASLETARDSSIESIKTDPPAQVAISEPSASCSSIPSETTFTALHTTGTVTSEGTASVVASSLEDETSTNTTIPPPQSIPGAESITSSVSQTTATPPCTSSAAAQPTSTTPRLKYDLRRAAPPQRPGYSLEGCLKSFTDPEILSGSNKFQCKKCSEAQGSKKGTLVIATKQFILQELPPVLIIHVKRFMQSPSGRLSKINDFVSYPMTLDLSPYCLESVTGSTTYRLYGIVEHHGSMTGGHYTATVSVDEGDWHHFSDTHVSSGANASAADAYLLFYVRC
ncbi:ubiquitin carboxyl-terminal hydrolase 45 [Pelomyxa schiedti]|nr:ubiquitin carboxyl-terminal hydrolase 45 [Pelomyxa schiedti]